MGSRKHLTEDNIAYLEQTAELIESMGADLYQKKSNGIYNSSVGQHIRHILDHYQCLLKMNDGYVDYDQRERDPSLENDPVRAIAVISKLIEELRKLEPCSIFKDETIKVLSNTDHKSSFSISSVNRELQFLISHTVHHFAIIAMILDSCGFVLPDYFGVAPSTLKYQQEIS